jgi:peptide/nickel transport system substrate-binding protein
MPIKIMPVKTPPALAEQADWDKKLVFSLAPQRFPNRQQLQYLPEYLSKKEKIIIRSLLALIIISLGFLTVRFYHRHIVYLPRDGGTYSEALVGQPSFINPVLAQSDIDRDISKLIYSGLFTYNQQLELVPDLAQSYEISDDLKTYTVHLRPHIKWHNGNELLADDVVYTFETIKDPDYNSPQYASFKGVTVERVDDLTVKFTLSEAFAPFLSNLTMGILPAHLWNDLTAANFRLTEYNTKPIGSGPYEFKELTKDHSGNMKTFLLVRNEQYYGHKPYIGKITLRFYDGFDAAVAAAQNNSINGVSYVPKELKGSLQKNDDISIHPLHLPQYTAVFFNEKNALLKIKEVRQALAYATDKNSILSEVLNNDGLIANSPILAGFLGYHPDIKKYDYNPAQAADILEKAGWKISGDQNVRQKNNAQLQFSLTTVDQPEYVKTAEILKKNWEAIGASVELRIMNPSRVDKEVIKPRNFETFLYGEIVGADPDPYPFWHSSQILGSGLNLSNFYNKDADKLLEDARKLKNNDERAKKYIDFQNILAEDLPAVFLYSPIYDYGVTHKVKGIVQERITIPSDRFTGIEDWYINTKLGWK